MPARIFIADLRHNFSGVLANDCMPLGVAYLKAVIDRDLADVDCRLFAYPDKLLEALDAEMPDVLMLSNYMWNESLSFQFAEIAKRRNPDTLVVMGGPNIYLEPERQLEYLAQHPEVDVYVLGEGEFLARDLVQKFVELDKSLERLRKEDLHSCIYRSHTGELMRGEMWDRTKEIEDIPSPWLTGCLDEFFDGKLAPLLETNRGCPFQCTFCVQGVRWYTKVHNFTQERIRDEVEYIGSHIAELSPSMGTLRIADSNFGMFERDIEISEYIGASQRDYGWPTYIDATTGKNRPERVIQSLEKMNGALVLYQAVQSLDDDTLTNIKRSNISNQAYEDIMVHVRGRGLRSLSDLILGLPGETLKSHIESICYLLDTGTNEMHNFQSMLLKGSELETDTSRSEHGFETRFRVLPKNYGIYDGKKVFDVDEIVVATKTLSFDEYLICRTHHLACSIFWNNSWFTEAVEFAQTFGVKASEWFLAVVSFLQEAEGAMGKLREEFLTETRNELFPTREACVEFYSQDENFERLQRGDIGDNLMYKYRALASFYIWPEVCAAAFETTKRLLLERGAGERVADFSVIWDDLHRFVELQHAHGRTTDSILAPATGTLSYDIPAWLAAGMPHDTARFALGAPRAFSFELSDEAAHELKAALDVWSSSMLGLSKGVTRIRPQAQIRACRPTDAGVEEVTV